MFYRFTPSPSVKTECRSKARPKNAAPYKGRAKVYRKLRKIKLAVADEANARRYAIKKITMKKFVLVLFIFALSFSFAAAQKKTKFNHAAQKKFIPAELGKVYLGMPFDEFSKQFDLKNAEVGDTRFEWLELAIPFQKGSITKLTVKIHGLTQDDKKAILRRETANKKSDDGYEYDEEIYRLILDKIPSKGFVYAIYVDFKPNFDLKNYAIKTYGTGGEVRKADDQYHFFDMQWTKKTSDNLMWLIRSFHEGDRRSLQLLGRIDGTEWGLD